MAVAWDEHVNQKVRRDSTWNEVTGFISDETLSGKTKRRMAHSLAKRPFRITMIFDYTEYEWFKYWYQNVTKRGTLSFAFPKIDSSAGTGEYRFTSDGAPQYSQTSGQLITCTMGWEEV